MGRKKLAIYAGDRYGRLSIISEAAPHITPGRHKTRKFSCVCECGKYIDVVMSSLRRGVTKSCGCLRKEISGAPDHHATHGLSHDKNGKNTKLYLVWGNMKGRCANTTHKGYPHYGGRGIYVCSEWILDYLVFHEWAMNSGYEQAHKEGRSLDRIDNDGPYAPENCRWATKKEQRANQRPRKPRSKA